jgi:inhibitor of KinA sporulation pathway (predicted exonuclease)
MKGEYYYINNEKLRKEHLNNKFENWSDEKHTKNEKQSINLLHTEIVKKKNKESIITVFHNFINPKHLDYLRELCKLTDSNIKNYDNETIDVFKNLLIDLLEYIPERIKNEYNSNGIIKAKSNQKYLFFLKLNELLK